MHDGYLYLIQEREFINSGQPVYKFGRTMDIVRRLKQYPNNSKLLFVSPSTDMVKHERIILHRLMHQFGHRRDIGFEYFEGDLFCMLREIYRLVSLLNTSYEVGYTDSSTQTTLENTETNNTDNVFEKFKFTAAASRKNHYQ